jgi:hypothetical protein
LPAKSILFSFLPGSRWPGLIAEDDDVETLKQRLGHVARSQAFDREMGFG